MSCAFSKVVRRPRQAAAPLVKVLLDTHVVLWCLSAPAELRADTRGKLQDPDNAVLLSGAVIDTKCQSLG